MKLDKDRLLYFIGTGLLIVAIIEVTIVPYLINRFLPALFIPVKTQKIVIGSIYLMAFLSYAFSGKYFYRQIQTIISVFIYFLIFSIIYKFF